eukprot:8391010-Ditylum_brightwellii.AAC.1
MDLWKAENFDGLVDDTIAEGRALEGRQRNGEEALERRACQFNGTVLAGKLRQAVRRASDREGG